MTNKVTNGTITMDRIRKGRRPLHGNVRNKKFWRRFERPKISARRNAKTAKTEGMATDVVRPEAIFKLIPTQVNATKMSRTQAHVRLVRADKVLAKNIVKKNPLNT